MKNQYFGDIGDYGKYALLRFLADNGIKIAVNWYLTADDGSSDGKHTTYLQKKTMRRYDSYLYDALAEMVSNGRRDLLEFEEKNMISDAIYYHELLENKGKTTAEKTAFRERWHKNALDSTVYSDLVFLDPDNGACEEKPRKSKDAIKYCYADEIADYYNRGQDVVYYCSRGRRTYEQWESHTLMMQRKIPEARIVIITFRKGTQRSYVFVLHQETYHRISELLIIFLARWPQKIFTEGLGKPIDYSKRLTGENICLTNTKGVTVTIEECEDGWVNIKYSDEKNTYHRISVDHLLEILR